MVDTFECVTYNMCCIKPSDRAKLSTGDRQMRRKPRGSKYHNLTARDEVIYYERVFEGERVRFSTKSSDWDIAAAVRNIYEDRREAGRVETKEAPTFRDFSARYLQKATHDLAATTRGDRVMLLSPGGILERVLGGLRLDEITRPLLLEWWHTEVTGKGRSDRTGMNYLSAISAVLGYAMDLGVIPENAVDALRATLRRKRRTKRGRATADGARHVRPIEQPEDLRAFIEASEAARQLWLESGDAMIQRRDGHVADLLQLDAGLRSGEVAGLRWRHVRWGDGPDDTSRALAIRESRARGKHDGPPKSGRERKVALSRRLRRVLREFWIAKGQPAPGDRVLPGFEPRKYQLRHFDEVCRVAKLKRHTPKDLRDTYASQLLTCGVQLAYVSKQLGHAKATVTADHYAKWCGGDDYRNPMTPGPGEVPADLLARICIESPQKSPQAQERGQ
jgi:integrase